MSTLAIILLVCSAAAYAVHLIFFTCGWYRLSRKDHSGETKKAVTLSILLPVRNEGSTIEKVIFSLSKQDFSTSRLEVIIIDDGSDDGTADIAEKLFQLHGLGHFRLARLSPGIGKKQAIETGINMAKGEIILTTDADCIHSPGWALAMTKAFMDPQIMMIAGPVRLEPGKGLLSAFQELEFLGLILSGAGAAGMFQAIYCNGASLAYRRNAFLEVDGFSGNEKYRSGDDVFLLHKIKKHFGRRSIGYTLDPSARVDTQAAEGVRAFIDQRSRWASKSKGYKDGITLSTAISVFIFNAVILLLAGLRIAGQPGTGWFALSAWGFKLLVDFPLLYSGTAFFGRRSLLWGYPLFQLVYPFYVVVVASRSLIGGITWKGSR